PSTREALIRSVGIEEKKFLKIIVRMGMARIVCTTDTPKDVLYSFTHDVILMSGYMMIWNGTKAQMSRAESRIFPPRTFQHAKAYPQMEEIATDMSRLGTRMRMEFQKPDFSPLFRK